MFLKCLNVGSIRSSNSYIFRAAIMALPNLSVVLTNPERVNIFTNYIRFNCIGDKYTSLYYC